MEFDAPWWDPDCEIVHLVWEDEVRRAVSGVHVEAAQLLYLRYMYSICTSFICCHDSGHYGGSEPRPAEILDKEVVWFHRPQTH